MNRYDEFFSVRMREPLADDVTPSRTRWRAKLRSTRWPDTDTSCAKRPPTIDCDRFGNSSYPSQSTAQTPVLGTPHSVESNGPSGRHIDNLDVPGRMNVGRWASARRHLKEIAKSVVNAGGYVIRKLRDCFRLFPRTLAGLLVGLFLGLIASSALVHPDPMAVSLIMVPFIFTVLGFRKDIDDPALRTTLDEVCPKFRNRA